MCSDIIHHSYFTPLVRLPRPHLMVRGFMLTAPPSIFSNEQQRTVQAGKLNVLYASQYLAEVDSNLPEVN